ncbi:MAG: ATP-binding protein, partial [Nitrososphaerales archaeon]
MSIASSARIKNPFKPGKPVDPEYFGGRKKELERFKQYLDYSAGGNPHNLAILGERGIGKSSVLRKFQEIATSDQNECVVVRRELDASVDSLTSLTLFLLEALKSEGSSFASSKRKAASKVISFFSNYKVGVSVLGHGLSLERIASRSVPIQDYFYTELMHIWEGSKEGTKGIVLLIDEAEYLQSITGAWSFLRSVFTRVSEQDAGYMLVVSGKLSLFRGIKEIFSPIERFFTPLEIMPMLEEEVRETLQKPLQQSLKARIGVNAIRRIFQYSGGHPYIVQTFGLYIFEESERRMGATRGIEIDEATVERILPKVMSRLTSQIFKDRFDQTSPLERKVLLVVSNLSSAGGQEVTPQQVAKQEGLKKQQLAIRTILGRLVDKDCLIKT